MLGMLTIPSTVVAPAVPVVRAAAAKAGPLRGPRYIVPGQRVRFRLAGSSRPMQLCYQAGSGRKTCYAAARSWSVLVRPSAVQYFTVRSKGKVVGRLIYVDGTLRTKI
jgi:hypothetical protein